MVPFRVMTSTYVETPSLVEQTVTPSGHLMSTEPFQSLVHAIATSLPGAQLDHNFGPTTDSWKVGGKLFAIAGPEAVSVKCPDRETAAMLVDVGQALPAPYLARSGWVQVTSEALRRGEVTQDDLRHRLRVSYDTIVATLPKRLRPPPEA